jgi:hypothetical protein
VGWIKLGHVFAPDGTQAWARGYAAFPTATVRPNGELRIYYTALDAQRQGRSSYIDVAGDDPRRIVRRCGEPVLEIGEMGDFDEGGANIFGVATLAGRRLFYYQGWQHTRKAPYLIFTGAAGEPADGEPLVKLQRTPVLDRTPDEPTMRAAPFVLNEGDGLRMWYVSCVRWRMVEGAPRYLVEIRTATSPDGRHWTTDPSVCLSPEGDEYAVGRPSVLRTDAGYEMWFSVRSANRPYRLGHARSSDGVRWVRDDAADTLIGTSAAGWDAEMVCYPNVIDHDGRRFLFYNGNRHGETGFGVARWQD